VTNLNIKLETKILHQKSEQKTQITTPKEITQFKTNFKRLNK